MTKTSAAFAIIAAVAASSTLVSGGAVAGDFYPDKFRDQSKPVVSSSQESGIPAQYRLR
ncbi:MAG: hypothetical protein QNJ62_01070 [Methyloceanibacter sp.]|nr:hypothetical protein [Methyloceanibacter sp.]